MTQAWANVSYGPKGLNLLKEGSPVDEVIRILTGGDDGRERRQLGIVDAMGNSTSFTGSECTPWAGSKRGRNYTVQGNIIESEEVLVAMAEAFESTRGELQIDWLPPSKPARRLAATPGAGSQPRC